MQTKKLGSGVYISAQDLLPLLILGLSSFFNGIAITAVDIGASISFLSIHQGTGIASVFICTAFCISAIWYFMSFTRERTLDLPIIVMNFAVGILTLLYISIFFINPNITSKAMMLFKDCFQLMMQTSFWVIAFRYGLLYKKPTIIAAIISAYLFGMICIAGTIYNHSEAPNLLILLAIISSALSTVMLKLMVWNGSAPFSKSYSFKYRANKSKVDVSQKRLNAIFFIFSGLLFFCLAIADYYFLHSVVEFNKTLADMGQSYSYLYLTKSVLLSALLYLFVKGKSNFYSLLYLIPLGVLLMIFAGIHSIFSLIILARAIIVATQFHSKEATLNSIPFMASLRNGYAKGIKRKAFVEPFALALAGVFIYFAEERISLETFWYILIAMTVALTGFMILMRQAYIKFAFGMIKHHLWRGGRFLFIGKRMTQLIEQNLADSNPDEVIYALRLLEESLSPAFIKALEKALLHPSEDVRLYALHKIALRNFTFEHKNVVNCIKTETSSKVLQAAWNTLCRIGTPEDREKAAELVSVEDCEVGALAGLLAIGREGAFTAIERVSFLANSPFAEYRKTAAKILGEAGNPTYYNPLYKLLYDENFEVCQEALKAASKISNTKLLPAIMDIFRIPELREDATNVLLQYKEKAFPEIERIIKTPEYPVQFRMLLARVLGRIPTPSSEKLLFSMVNISDRQVRFNVIKSLVLMRYKASLKQANAVRLCLYDELEETSRILSMIDVLEKNDGQGVPHAVEVFKSALYAEIEQIKERILLLLALLSPSEKIINYLNTESALKEEHPEVIEWINSVLTGELRLLCLPLFKDKPVHEQLMLLRPHFLPPVFALNDYIKEVLEAHQGQLSDWVKISAIYLAGFIKDIMFINPLVKLLSDPDYVIRETAVWAIGEILPHEESFRIVSPMLGDRNNSVVRIANFVTDTTRQLIF